MNRAALALFAPLLLLATASTAGTQQPRPAPASPLPPIQAPPQPPSGTIPLPTPPPAKAPPPPPVPSLPAALTVPNPFGGLVQGPRDLYQSRDGSDRFQQLRPPRFPRVPVFGGGGYYGWPYYPDPYYTPGPEQMYDRLAPEPAELRGGLVLETIPGSAQVFVDGFYVGLAEEFGLRGRPMSITAGPHRIELRAPAYNTLAFNVRIEPHQILRYRGDMQFAQMGPPVTLTPTQPPAAARTMYVIPRCYAGDKPPRGPLPKGCDRKNLQTYK